MKWNNFDQRYLLLVFNPPSEYWVKLSLSDQTKKIGFRLITLLDYWVFRPIIMKVAFLTLAEKSSFEHLKLW
jgi:hypothetical protein